MDHLVIIGNEETEVLQALAVAIEKVLVKRVSGEPLISWVV
jgi:hypothetical protein